jgi:hypothetical protein
MPTYPMILLIAAVCGANLTIGVELLRGRLFLRGDRLGLLSVWAAVFVIASYPIFVNPAYPEDAFFVVPVAVLLGGLLYSMSRSRRNLYLIPRKYTTLELDEFRKQLLECLSQSHPDSEMASSSEFLASSASTGATRVRFFGRDSKAFEAALESALSRVPGSSLGHYRRLGLAYCLTSLAVAVVGVVVLR